ncbi:AlbA family DNA-binding domain-containing protein [Actinophytocola sp.]|uniref:AlbA family DNA-binding domain-containing protein n=1 Tax=Actinophytocola sp. TaxID=1872138 RepID=UPI003D6BC033
MVALRSRRLETLFGAHLSELRAAHIHSLVESSTQESFDLEFKGEPYGRGDSDRRALAGDVAALANTAGGLILIGVTEDAQSRAEDDPGAELSGAEVRRIEQVVASLVAPVPVFDVWQVVKEPHPNAPAGSPPADGTQGFILIAVARGTQYPHAVLVNDGLRFPKRNGSTTRYLSEPEVAAAYRDRLAGWEQRARRVTEIEQDALARLDTTDQDPWVVVTLVPDQPGEFVITQAAYSAFQRELRTTPVRLFTTGTTFTRFATGRRRLLADGTHNNPLARYGSLELHTDGSGVYAVNVHDLSRGRSWETPNDETPRVRLISDDALTVGLVSGLLYLARHAQDRAAAGGGVLVRAQLHPVSDQQPIQIGHRTPFNDPRSPQALTTAPPPAETAAALDDLIQPGPELLATACRLVDEIGQAFGIPEMGQLTTTGELRQRHWDEDFGSLMIPWAKQHGITVTEDVIKIE